MKKDFDLDSLFQQLELSQNAIPQKNPIDEMKKELQSQITALDKILKIAKEKNQDTTENNIEDQSNSQDDGL